MENPVCSPIVQIVWSPSGLYLERFKENTKKVLFLILLPELDSSNVFIQVNPFLPLDFRIVLETYL